MNNTNFCLEYIQLECQIWNRYCNVSILCQLWSSVLWHHVLLPVSTSNSEEHCSHLQSEVLSYDTWYTLDLQWPQGWSMMTFPSLCWPLASIGSISDVGAPNHADCLVYFTSPKCWLQQSWAEKFAHGFDRGLNPEYLWMRIHCLTLR